MYEIRVENRGDSRFHASTRSASFVLDTEGKGVGPVEAVLAGLCACIAHYVRDYTRAERLESTGFTVEAEATPTPDGARLAAVAVRIDPRGLPLDERRRAELLTHVTRCKIHNTLKAACQIEIAYAHGA